MTEEQYKTMASFSQQLDEMRETYDDQQLLDWCGQVLATCVEELKDGPFDPEPPEPEPPAEEEKSPVEEGTEPPPPEKTMGEKMAALVTALKEAPAAESQ